MKNEKKKEEEKENEEHHREQYILIIANLYALKGAHKKAPQLWLIIEDQLQIQIVIMNMEKHNFE